MCNNTFREGLFKGQKTRDENSNGTDQPHKGTMQEYFRARLPLFYVFLSGIGFSLQALVIKVLTEQGFKGSFQCVFLRGFLQIIMTSYYIYYDEDRLLGNGPKLFGNTSWVRFIILLRSLAGFGSIAFAFLAVELIPMGDSTVLIMLSPLLASIMSYLFLGEQWRLPELCATVLSLVGAVMVAKPQFIFGGHGVHSASIFRGVSFALVSAVCAACAFILVRILGTTAKMPWSNVGFAQAIGQMALSIPGLYISGQHLTFDLTLFQFSLLFAGGLIGAISQMLMTIGMQREKSAAATAMRMSDVAFGFVWQACFTSDPLSLLSLGGAVLVTCSILVVVISKEQVAAPTATAAAPATAADADSKKRKQIEMQKLTAAVHSIANSMHLKQQHGDYYDELERDMDMELGFQDSCSSDGDNDHNEAFKPHNTQYTSHHMHGKGTQKASGDNNTLVVADESAEFNEMDDSVMQSFLARMVKSPLYSGSLGAAAGAPKHQYSSLAQGDEADNPEETDL